ncbi:Uncharacterised protein [uncultured archaeon]|nr:Uncharacterised protein [uncultured archaeon]
MPFPVLRSSRNDKLYSSIRNNLMLLAAGAAIGAAATMYIADKRDKVLNEDIMRQNAAIAAMEKDRDAKAKMIADLVEDNSTLFSQNRNFWVELKHKKRQGSYAAKLKRQDLMKPEADSDSSRIIRSPFQAGPSAAGDAGTADTGGAGVMQTAKRPKKGFFSSLFGGTK